MDESEFWEIIALARGSADEMDLHRVWLRLRQSDPETIIAFDDRLAEVLHRMDLRPIARQGWRDVSEPWWLPRVPGISADGFLYARCAAVLQGRETVEQIVADPRSFKRRWDVSAEALLDVARTAWEARTRRHWDEERESPVSYETGSNPAGGW